MLVAVVLASSLSDVRAGSALGQAGVPLPSERVAQVANLFDAIGATLAALDAAAVDPDLLAATIDDDPATAFAWVRDYTDWVPYLGALRGPAGVMLDRVGNSLDRSLLLAQLLERHGHKVRLARATPPDAEIDRWIAAVRPRRAAPVASISTSAGYADRIWEAIDGAPMPVQRDAMRNLQRESTARIAAIRARAKDRVAAQSSLLLDLLADRVSAGGAGDDAARTAMRDHWWVQVRGDGGWVDLDPLLPDAEVGEAPAGRGRSVSFRRRDGQIVVDRRLEHEVELRVLVEQTRNGRQREREVISHVLRPRELGGRAVSLFAYPLHAVPPDEEPDADDRRAALERQADRSGEWLPVLRIGRDVVYDRSFTADGAVKRPNLAPLAENERQLGGALGRLGMLDEALAGSGAEEADPSIFASAAWIEYEIRSPGADPLVVRRPLFDLIGRARGAGIDVSLTAAMRLAREMELTTATDLLVVGSDVPADFVEAHTLRSLAAMRTDVMALAAAENPGEVADVASSADLPEVQALELYGLAVARAAWRNDSSDVFVAGPNVLTFRQAYGLDPAGALRIERTFDIVANGVATLAGGDTAFAGRLAQGVLDTNVEALLLDGEGALPNAADRLATTTAADWVVIGPGDALPWGDDPAMAVARALMEDDRAAGRTIVAPVAPGIEGPTWWSVDPATGTTLGMGPVGGQKVEYIALLIRLPMCLLPLFSDAGVSAAICVGGAMWGAPAVGGVAWFMSTIMLTAVENLILWAADPGSWPPG